MLEIFDPNALIQYGVLGSWTIYLIWKENGTSKELKNAIENNTLAMTKVHTVLTFCEQKNRRK